MNCNMMYYSSNIFPFFKNLDFKISYFRMCWNLLWKVECFPHLFLKIFFLIIYNQKNKKRYLKNKLSIYKLLRIYHNIKKNLFNLITYTYLKNVVVKLINSSLYLKSKILKVFNYQHFNILKRRHKW